MDLKTIRDLQSSIGAAAGVVLAEELSKLAKVWLVFLGAPALLSLAVIAVSVVLARYMGTEIFDHWKWIRKKLIGQQYIEGTWFDIMKLDGQPMDIGISTFEYVAYEIRYTGQDYNLAKGSWAPYHTKMVKLEWPRLTYIYTAQRPDAKSVEMTGYGVLDFHDRTKGPPTTHSGQYLALQSSERISFESFRLDEKRDSNVLAQLVEPTTKRQALFALFEKYGSTVGEIYQSDPAGAPALSNDATRNTPEGDSRRQGLVMTYR